MKDFYLYLLNGDIKYSANQIFETDEHIFLVDSNKEIKLEDIICLNGEYDIKNNLFYGLIVFNKTTKMIKAKYGFFSYCHSLYYMKTSNAFYVDLHLKNLLNYVDFKLKLNDKSANEFVNYGFLNGNESLIENIYRIPAKKTLIYNAKEELIDSNYLEFNKDYSDYAKSLAINLPKTDKITIPLSGGYDSTLLAFLTKDYKYKKAITVGSYRDKNNEFKTASLTAKNFDFNHILIADTSKWLKSLDKIVEIMEGEMYDPGLFLSYAIVEKIKELNIKDYTIISGDGADQLLNVNFYNSNLSDELIDDRHTSKFYQNNPLQILYNLIVKKLEWLLRENEVSYCTPFLSSEFYNCSKNIKSVEKEEYKYYVKELIPKEISINLSKKGGLVQEKFFTLKSLDKPTIINDKFFAVRHHIENKSQRLHTFIYRLYLMKFEEIFIKHR